jgi:CheY-like chemotaxis protein
MARIGNDLETLYEPATANSEDLQERLESERHRASQAEAQLHELEAESRRREQIVARISHDLRTPLTPMSTAVQILRQESLSVAARRYVDVIGRNLEAQVQLIDELAKLGSTAGNLSDSAAREPKGSQFVRRDGSGRTPQLLRVLLVDDHEDSVTLTRLMLERRGHKVVTAHSVRDAMACAAQTSFDLLVSDISLPDDSGLSLLRQIRARGPIVAIALSGFGRDTDIARSKAAGFAEHLTKPVSFQRLDEAIQRIFGSS